MADFWLAPYLPLYVETDVGPWRFIPFHEFKQRHTHGRDIYGEVRKLVTAYQLKERGPWRFGAVIVPKSGRVGDEVPRELLPPLRRALAAALIDSNPSYLVDEEEQPNAGHAVATADNGIVFGHPISGGHHYVFDEGGMLQTLDVRSAPAGKRLPPVLPPPGLPKPILGRSLDEEYAAALYDTLISGSDDARRLDRCIQWLVLAWSNTEVVGEDARILAFRAAFEVLLGGGSDTKAHRSKFAKLICDTSAPKPRSWKALSGKPKTEALNEAEWWFQSMAFLRNAIMHGDEIDQAQWVFAETGKRHLWHADDYLRTAIKKTVIATGHGSPELELAPFQRHLRRGYEEADARHRNASSTDSR